MSRVLTHAVSENSLTPGSILLHTEITWRYAGITARQRARLAGLHPVRRVAPA